jgi:hypothetical protein
MSNCTALPWVPADVQHGWRAGAEWGTHLDETRASGIPPRVVWGIVRGSRVAVSHDMHARVCVLHERTWDQRSPDRTAIERRAAAAARCRAASQGWPAARRRGLILACGTGAVAGNGTGGLSTDPGRGAMGGVVRCQARRIGRRREELT